MKVKDLIEKLLKFDENANVWADANSEINDDFAVNLALPKEFVDYGNEKIIPFEDVIIEWKRR